MAAISTSRLQELLQRTIGPAPWYWKTFPDIISASGRRLVWAHHSHPGPLAYLVSLSLEGEPDQPRLALNSYCRPFPMPQHYLGVWCPEGRNIRFLCFDPDQLKEFDFAEIAGWFKQSAERVYAGTPPVAEFELPGLGSAAHAAEFPPEFRAVDELIVPASYPAKSYDDPAFALYVFYPRARLVEVLPQKWFTASQYEVGRQWITRAARDPDSQRIFGECHGSGSFLLQEDGCHLERWLDRT